MEILGLYTPQPLYVFGGIGAFLATYVLVSWSITKDVLTIFRTKEVYKGQREHYMIAVLWTLFAYLMILCIFKDTAPLVGKDSTGVDGVIVFNHEAELIFAWVGAAINFSLSKHIKGYWDG